MADWDGQSPPTSRTYKGKPVPSIKALVGANRNLPNFGEFGKEKKRLLAEEKKSTDLLGDNQLPNLRPGNKPDKKIPSVSEVIGRALDKIGTYNDLDNKYTYFLTKNITVLSFANLYLS